jgi:molybdenum cofactor cytidylyltransferase
MIAAVVLAAGESRRMGTAKALLSDGARSFVAAIVETARAAGAGEVIVVVGPPHGEAIERALPAGAIAARNPDPSRGMLSSVQCGVAAASASAALIWPVDIPRVRVETVRAILAAAPEQIVIPTHAGRGGHPIRIPRARFAELAALDPSRGLKALIESRPEQVIRLPVDDDGVLRDVDTPEDLARLRAR